MHQHGRPPLTPHGMGRASSDFRTFDTPVNRHQRRRCRKKAHNATQKQTTLRAWITYSNTDILQAPGTVVLCCLADFFSYSATARYVIREYGQEIIFRLKPSVGTTVRLDRSPTAPWNNQIFLLCTRASNKHPLLHETLHACLNHLLHQLHRCHVTRFHLPIYDPERSINLLSTWYATLRDPFTGHNSEIILHDRVYVSTASVTSSHVRITDIP